MHTEHGGKVTLRLARVSPERAEYDAELTDTAAVFTARATVALPAGAVDFAVSGDAPPAWLLELARTTLRAAHRTASASGTWPRRLSRWRGGPGAED